MSAERPCVRCARIEDSAAASLATVAACHGLTLGAGEVAPLVGLPSVFTLTDCVVASRLLGFDSVPLEGGYDELPEVERPNIVAYKDGRFVVLHEIDADGVTVSDPLSGVERLPRDSFTERWTGDCLRLVAATDWLPRARTSLEAHRNTLRRFFAPRKLLALASALAVLGLVAWAGFSLLTIALGVAATGSLWLVFLQPSCASCRRAHALAGALPLDRIGAGLYLTLLVAARSDVGLVAWPLAVAAGAHLALVAILALEKTACVPCLVTGAAALVASGVAVAQGTVSPAIVAVLALSGAAGDSLAVPFFRRAADDAALSEARRVAFAWAQGAGATEPGKTRVVVWKRSGCPACLLFEAVIKPALVQDFEDGVVIEERDASGLGIPTPLVLVAGSVRVLFVGLPGTDHDYEKIQLAVRSAGDPAFAALSPLGGLLVVA